MSYLRDTSDYVLFAFETIYFRYVKYLHILCYMFKDYVHIIEVMRSLREYCIIQMMLCEVIMSIASLHAYGLHKSKFCIFEDFSKHKEELCFLCGL